MAPAQGLDAEVKPLRSKKYRDGARGQFCTFLIPGVCQGGTETTVFCHIYDKHHGMGQKASDLSGADGDHNCHAVMDRRARMPDGNLISEEDWHYYALRALQATLERRVEQGILKFPHDPPPKPKAERKPKQPRPSRWAKGRTIPSRKMGT